MTTATALANPNIAFIKYWGDHDSSLRIPVNGSISMNLAGLETRTRVTFDPGLADDSLYLNNQEVTGPRLERVTRFLDLVRGLAGKQLCAIVESENNFPTGAGIASSASAFAALAVAAAAAAGLQLSEQELSRLARRGSGSACRSVPGGYVEWQAGLQDEASYAFSLAPPGHWDLVDCIAVIQTGHKRIGSTQGHSLAATSPLQHGRVKDAPRRLGLCRSAVLDRDFDALAQVIELDSNMMHAVMMTSTPPLIYWQPSSLRLMKAVQRWRGQGCPVCYTLDAGPNVHVLCPSDYASQLKSRLQRMDGVQQVLVAQPGGPAHLISDPG